MQVFFNKLYLNTLLEDDNLFSKLERLAVSGL